MKQVFRKSVAIMALFTVIATYGSETSALKAYKGRCNGIDIPKELIKKNEPSVQVKDNYLIIYQDIRSEQVLNVKIYFDTDTDGTGVYDLIHSELIESSSAIKRVYQLDKNEVGRYKLVLTWEGEQFIEKFSF
jgi:hypothetical protein